MTNYQQLVKIRQYHKATYFCVNKSVPKDKILQVVYCLRQYGVFKAYSKVCEMSSLDNCYFSATWPEPDSKQYVENGQISAKWLPDIQYMHRIITH